MCQTRHMRSWYLQKHARQLRVFVPRGIRSYAEWKLVFDSRDFLRTVNSLFLLMTNNHLK